MAVDWATAMPMSMVRNNTGSFLGVSAVCAQADWPTMPQPYPGPTPPNPTAIAAPITLANPMMSVSISRRVNNMMKATSMPKMAGVWQTA